jgi:cobalt transporter subunit CbtB
MQTGIIDFSTMVRSRAASRADALVGVIFAALLGGLLVCGVGFSHIDIVHNAAHDFRHSTGFPCH